MVHQEKEISIDDVGSGGDGVGRLADGCVVFVPHGLPGDRLLVRLTHMRKRVQHAELVAIIQPSVHRVAGECVVTACTGCDLKYLSASAQAALKRRRVVETMRRVGNVDIETLLGPVQQCGDGWHSRHRVRLHAVYGGGRWRLGYFSRGSRNLVELQSCPIAWRELEPIVLALADALATLPASAGLDEVEVVYSRLDGGAALRLIGSVVGKLEHHVETPLSPAIRGVEVDTPGATFRCGDLALRYDHGRAREFELRFEPGVFTQANPDINDALVAAVLAAVGSMSGQRLLELHAGIGNFSLPLALAGVVGVATEGQASAALWCRQNAAKAGVAMDVRTLSDDQAVVELSAFHAVLLDPPRVGAHAAALAIAQSRSIERVAYVGCDPATLARDAALLVAGGFAVVAAQSFDMFPQTTHVETLLVLER